MLGKRKVAKRVEVSKERDLRKQKGKMDKPLHVSIELDIFPKYNISCSNYHGGAMEGPSIRRLMMNGPEVFDDISSFLKTSLRERGISKKYGTGQRNRRCVFEYGTCLLTA